MPSRRATRTGAIAGATAFVAMAGLYVGQLLNPETGPEFVGAPTEAMAPQKETFSSPGLLCLALTGLREQLGPVGESSYSISVDPADGSGHAGVYAQADFVEAAADTVEAVLFRGSGPVGQYGPTGSPAVDAAEASHDAVPVIVAEQEAADELAPRDTWGGAYLRTPARLEARDALNTARESTDHALQAAMCDPVDV